MLKVVTPDADVAARGRILGVVAFLSNRFAPGYLGEIDQCLG
ncbi:MAG: hypothetical protein OXH76_09900 [Boseongicola sp.]|nr:hypothetical protein [Boseongicola sp.]